MSLASRLLRVTLLFPLLAQAGVMDTYERETQKRREDGYRADAPNNPGSTPQVPQGFIDEMRRRTEPQGGQDISPATRAFMAEKEEQRRREIESREADERRKAERAAQERAAFLLDYNTRLARVNAIYAEDAASATPNQPAVFDRAMAVAYPEINVMLSVARRAQQIHPELWRLRLGFLLSAGCDDEALQTRMDSYDESLYRWSRTMPAYCDKSRYYRGLSALQPVLKDSSVLNRALFCGLIYNWTGRWGRGDPYHDEAPRHVSDELYLARETKACLAALPAGHAFTEGLFKPLFLLGERDKRDLSQVFWWPLFSPATWEGVNLADAAAIRAVVDRVAEENLALQPTSYYSSGAPSVLQSDPLIGATPDQVRKALGRPSKKLPRLRVDIPSFADRQNCLAWQERGPLNTYAYAEKFKVSGGGPQYRINWVVFNRDEKACAIFQTEMRAYLWKEL